MINIININSPIYCFYLTELSAEESEDVLFKEVCPSLYAVPCISLILVSYFPPLIRSYYLFFKVLNKRSRLGG